MTAREALIGLNFITHIGSIRLRNLLAFFGAPEKIIGASAEELTASGGIDAKTAREIAALKTEEIDKELALARKMGLTVVTVLDAEYPQNLANIIDPAPVLYVKGRLCAQDCASIALVGSRHATVYGLTHGYSFARRLAECGFTIVSGMARGVDAAAHRGALIAGGRTIAVMGSGFCHPYPPEHKDLLEEISRHGAVVSEFPLSTRPLKLNFPRRNRLISGLSMGVLVVEAARNSGALITVDFAVQQGRDVFALPAPVDSINAFGVNELIKEGAQLVSSPEEIIEEYIGRQHVQVHLCDECAKEESPTADSLTQEILDMLADSCLHLDQLHAKTNMDISRISDILLQLQLKGLIQELPGKHFVRSVNGN